MLSRSFLLFFINPIVSIWHLGKKTLRFLESMSKQVLLKKSFVLTDDSVLQDANNVYRIILVVVLSKIALNEAFLNKDSNFIKENIAQFFIIIIYFFIFQLSYYYAKLLSYIKKDEFVKAIYLKLWQVYTLTYMFFILIFCSGDSLGVEELKNPFIVFTFVYLAHFVYLFFKFSFRHKAILLFFIAVPMFISVIFFNMIILAVTN
jgi:hypothetical protein